MPRDVTSDVPRVMIPAGTTRHGLVIGIDNYADSRLNLRCAAADARVLRELMIDAECGCFPHENVQLLLDEEATTEGVFRALARLRRHVAENDVVWIYYAGHAAVDDHAYWVTHDTDVDDLFATALSSDRIDSVLSQLRTPHLLLILDCCHAAAMALVKDRTRAVVTAKDLFGRFQGHGRITLAGSDGKQRSVELSEFGHGAFTYFLAKGLRGEADTDNDGVVTADELWSYLRRKVTEAAGRLGNPQTPMLSGSMTHDIALTLNVAVTVNKQRLSGEIEKLVGLRAHQLTTDEGRFCEEIVRRGARTESERLLLESLEELAAGQLTQSQFRRFVQANMQIISRQPSLPRAEAAHAASHVIDVNAREKAVADAGAERAEAHAQTQDDAAASARTEADTKVDDEAAARARAEAKARDEATARAQAQADARARDEASDEPVDTERASELSTHSSDEPEIDPAPRRITLRYADVAVRPEVHSPRQPSGDLADAPVSWDPVWRETAPASRPRIHAGVEPQVSRRGLWITMFVTTAFVLVGAIVVVVSIPSESSDHLPPPSSKIVMEKNSIPTAIFKVNDSMSFVASHSRVELSIRDGPIGDSQIYYTCSVIEKLDDEKIKVTCPAVGFLVANASVTLKTWP